MQTNNLLRDWKMERWVGKVAVVTGASSGIGKAVAEKLVKAGLLVVGFARREDRLKLLTESLKNEKGSFYGIVCDITKEYDVKNKILKVNNEISPINILINNAGIVKNGNIFEQPTNVWREIYELNVFALSILSREIVDLMKSQNIAGHIINVSSILGHYVPRLPSPELGMYPPTKHAVKAITETLRQEMEYYKTGIKVTSISPGYTKTEIFRNVENTSFKTTPVAFMEPEDVADAILYVLSTRPNVQIQDLILRPMGELF